MSLLAFRARQMNAGRLLQLVLGSTLSYSETVIADDPVRYYRLGEASGTTMSDSSGGSHDGTYNNNTLGATGLLTGDGDTAVEWDGSTSYATFPTQSTVPSAFTHEAWIYTHSVSTDNSVRQYITTDQSDPPSVASFTFKQRQGMMIEGDRIGGQAYSGISISTPSGSIAANTAYHVVFCGDSTGCRVYINGVEEASTTTAPTSVEVNEALIGRRADSEGEDWFDGVIDEVAIYDYALTANQVREHYWRGKGYTGYPLSILSSGPEAYYRLGESSGTTAADETGNFDATYSLTFNLGADGLLTDDKDTAVDFGGTGRADLPQLWTTGFSEISCEAWIKSTATGQNIIVSYDRNEYFRFAMGSDTSGAGRDGSLWATFIAGGVQYDSMETAAGLINDGVIHHVVFTFDNGSAKLYIDGEEVASLSANSTLGSGNDRYGFISSGSESSTFGDGADTPSDYFEGVLDEVAIYQRAIERYEVGAHYRKGTGVDDYFMDVIKDDPVSYWRLGESSGSTAADQMGNHDLTITGSPIQGATGLISGDDDTCYEFDGTNGNYLETSDRIFDGASEITLELWINEDTVSRTCGIAGRDNTGGDTSDVFSIAGFNTGDWAFRVKAGGTFHDMRVAASTGTHHLVLVYDGSTVSAYVDGVEVSSEAASGSLPVETTPFTVGTYSNHTSGEFLDGRIDEIAIYDYALSTDRIQSHYNTGTGS